jgi:hypothetical protein|tara:strand:+ start:109 stop:372 length:264 start_codon:yes stop_codon:yes gene_type:complete
MTSKEFKIWLEGLLTTLNLDNVEVRRDINPNYNNLTMLKTIHNKLKEVKDLDEGFDRVSSTLLTERLVPATPPNPFKITMEDKNKEE